VGKHSATGSLMEQVFVKVAKVVVEMLSWNLEFEALAAAGA